MTAASWVSGESEAQLSLPQGFSRLTYACSAHSCACEDMFTPMFMLKLLMSTCVGTHEVFITCVPSMGLQDGASASSS